jgi:hypothetical protein
MSGKPVVGDIGNPVEQRPSGRRYQPTVAQCRKGETEDFRSFDHGTIGPTGVDSGKQRFSCFPISLRFEIASGDIYEFKMSVTISFVKQSNVVSADGAAAVIKEFKRKYSCVHGFSP